MLPNSDVNHAASQVVTQLMTVLEAAGVKVPSNITDTDFLLKESHLEELLKKFAQEILTQAQQNT